VSVELSEEAEAHVLEIDSWWRENRHGGALHWAIVLGARETPQ
jgi:hypothetical protein